MGVVRRAALIFGLVLIVAIVVGYVARRSEVAGERDLRLVTAAELASSRLTAIVDTIEVAAAATDPEAAAAAVAHVNGELGVCAATDQTSSCAGDVLRRPPAELVRELQAARRDPARLPTVVPSIGVYDALLTIELDGPRLSVVARASADVIAPGSGYSAWVTTTPPPSISSGGFVVEQGVRQTAVVAVAAPGVYVVAAGSDAITLPVDEQRFYFIVFVLALVLLGLASVNLVVEQRSLVERACIDPLTKLPNRGEFERRVTDAIADAARTEQPLCLLLFDLDDFKLVNDTYGHQAGDQILRIIGARLREAVRDGDLVARWGGDEFVVAMRGIATEEMGTRRARELAAEVSGRTRIEGVADALRVKVSMGVAIWPHHGPDLESLVDAADAAMYEAKRDRSVCRVAPAGPRRVLVGTSA